MAYDLIHVKRQLVESLQNLQYLTNRLIPQSTMAPIAIHSAEPVAPASKTITTKANFHQDVRELAENPLHRTWRGNAEGTLRIDSYPSFMNATTEEDLLKKRQWVKEHLAIAFRFWGNLGYGEGISGHITVRVS